MKYQVSVATTVIYSIEVEANSFNDAAATALDKSYEIGRNIAQAASGFVPEGILDDTEDTVQGVYKLG